MIGPVESGLSIRAHLHAVQCGNPAILQSGNPAIIPSPVGSDHTAHLGSSSAACSQVGILPW